MYCGKHLIVDLWTNTHSDILTNAGWMNNMFIEAAKVCGATVLHTHWHHFGEGYGVTGVAVLAESHMSAHTWPEHGLATIDVYMCGDCDPELALPIFSREINPYKIVVNQLYRGVSSDASINIGAPPSLV